MENFKQDLKINLKGFSTELIQKRALGKDHYPLLAELYSFFMAIPITSVECERSFSKMNIIKTELRNGLYNDTLNDLMLIPILGPSNLEDFDPHPMINQWKTMTRYF